MEPSEVSHTTSVEGHSTGAHKVVVSETDLLNTLLGHGVTSSEENLGGELAH